MDVLKKELNIVELTENRVQKHRDCIENGLVRENLEEWFDSKNQKCYCKVSKNRNYALRFYKHNAYKQTRTKAKACA